MKISHSFEFPTRPGGQRVSGLTAIDLLISLSVSGLLLSLLIPGGAALNRKLQAGDMSK